MKVDQNLLIAGRHSSGETGFSKCVQGFYFPGIASLLETASDTSHSGLRVSGSCAPIPENCSTLFAVDQTFPVKHPEFCLRRLFKVHCVVE